MHLTKYGNVYYSFLSINSRTATLSENLMSFHLVFKLLCFTLIARFSHYSPLPSVKREQAVQPCSTLGLLLAVHLLLQEQAAEEHV